MIMLFIMRALGYMHWQIFIDNQALVVADTVND